MKPNFLEKRGFVRTLNSFKVRLRAIKAEFGIEHSQPKHLGIIQCQSLDSGSAARSLADDLERYIHRPLKMIVPTLSARIEQRHDFSVEGVLPVNVIQFAAVAVDTGEREVVFGVGAAMFFRNDVFELQWNQWGLVLVQLAILAPLAGSFPDVAFRFGVHHADRDRSFRTLAWRMAMNLLAFT